MARKFQKSMISSPSGAQIALNTLLPKGKTRGAVHINHGMGEHSTRYLRFATALSEAGFAVFAHDHRGHGGTTAPDAPKGVFAARDGFQRVIEDALAVNAHIHDEIDGPVIVFGHSMGSIIALNFALRHPERIDGLCCWNAGVETGALAAISKIILGAEKLVKGRDKPSNIARALTFETWNKAFKPNRTYFDWLSRDNAEVDKYIADPDCGFEISIGLWIDLLKGVYFGADDKNLKALRTDLPVHVQGGGADECSNKGRDMAHLAERLTRAGLSDVTLNILPGARHESVNETNRDEITANFVSWLEARFS